MRPHAFKMPLQVKLRVFDEEEKTIELPDDATTLTVKEWVRESTGVPESAQKVIVWGKGGRVLKNGDLLNSDPRFLDLKVFQAICGA
jgi:hypothetical protein